MISIMFQSHKNDHDGNYMILTLCFNHIIMIRCEIHDLSPLSQSHNHDLGVNYMVLALCPNHIITIRCVLHDFDPLSQLHNHHHEAHDVVFW